MGLGCLKHSKLLKASSLLHAYTMLRVWCDVPQFVSVTRVKHVREHTPGFVLLVLANTMYTSTQEEQQPDCNCTLHGQLLPTILHFSSLRGVSSLAVGRWKVQRPRGNQRNVLDPVSLVLNSRPRLVGDSYNSPGVLVCAKIWTERGETGRNTILNVPGSGPRQISPIQHT
jgi:hypothetical protein